MSSVTLNTSSSQPNIEGVRVLKVIDKDLVIQGLQQILRDSPEIEWSRLSDSIQKNSVIVLSKEYGASLDNFPPGAVVEDPSLTASKVSGISESFNTTKSHITTASGEHGFAAGKIVINNNYYNYAGIGPDNAPLDPVSSTSEVKAALRALYTSENFKTIRRLVDPTKSLSISESFIRLAVLLEKDFERAQKEALDGKKGDSIKNSDFVYLNSHEAIIQPKELIEVGKLFDYSNLDKLTPSRLLAVGAAGVGKSTLCQYLANTWAEHPEKLGAWKSKFDYLFLIRLRDLASYPSIPILAEAVKKSLRAPSLESIESILATCGDKILFLLDGYDEVASWLSQNEERDAFFRELMKQPHWVLTTRPNYFNESMGSYNCRKLEIVGFTRSDIKKYIDRFFKDSNCPERAPLVHQLLTSNTRIAALSHIPINLELLCSVWKMKRTPSTQSYTMTKLYGEISGFLFRRYIRDRLGDNSQGITLNFISGNEQYRPFLQAIETIAWKGLMSHTASLIIDRDIYEPVIGAILNARETPVPLKVNFYSALFNGLGFFRSVPSFENSENPDLADYYFIHLTFQEYFAARYFVRKFFPAGVQGEEWKERLNDMKFNPKFGVVFWFVAGLLCERVHYCSDSRNAEKEAKGTLDAFIKCLMSQPRSLLRSHELALAMHCSEELEGVSVPSQQEVLEELVVMLRNLVGGKMEELRRHSCAAPFQGIRKFYLMDKEQNILQTIKQRGFGSAAHVVTAFQLIAPGVVDFLIEKMKDPQGNTQKDTADQMTAAQSLGQLQLEGRTLAKVAEALIQRLGGGGRYVRFAAAQSLGQLQLEGETVAKVAEALIERLGDESMDVRQAAQSLGQLQLEGETVAKVAEALIERLGDESMDVRQLAARSLGQLQLEGETAAKVAEALIQRIGPYNMDAQGEVIRSLGQLQLEGETPRKIAEALIQRLLVDYDCFFEWPTVSALCKLQLDCETLDKVAEALIQRLGDEERNVRIAAAKSLAKFQLKGETVAKVAEALIERLGDESSYVREEAARSLGQLQLEGETVAKVAEALIQRIGDDNGDVREEAARSLGQLQLEGEITGKIADALIQRLLVDYNRFFEWPTVSAFCELQLDCETLGKVPEAHIQRLGDKDSFVRRAAAYSLGKLQLEGETLAKVAETLIQRLGDDGSFVRRAAAYSLGKLQLEGETLAKVAETLIQRLGDDGSFVRRPAAYSLGKLQLTGEALWKVAEALIQRLGDEDRFVRNEAAKSLGKFQLTGEALVQVVDALIQRLGDEDSSVRNEAAKSLGKLQLMGEALVQVVDALIQRLGDEDSSVRYAAAESLGKLQLTGEALWKVAESLIQRLGDEDRSVRYAAAKSLGKLQLTGEALWKVAESLIQRLGHKHDFVRKEAAKSLGKLQLTGEALVQVVDALIQRLGDEDSSVRSAAAESLGKLQLEGEGLEKVAEALIQRLGDEGFTVRHDALESFQTLIDIKKTYAQIKSNKKAAIKFIAYKIFLSETLCYYQEGCFYYYGQGRLSEPIEMDEDDYRKLERFMQDELLTIGKSNNLREWCGMY